MRRVVHGRIQLALHSLREGPGRPLLLLHGLGERAPEGLPPELGAWPGPIHALDFTGHGASSLPEGGGYTAEMLMADGDAALAALGPSTVVGRGLGAYVALLLAGARPTEVRGAILRDGPGLVGGGARPPTYTVGTIDPGAVMPPDPFALLELSRDVRPPDYAVSFARQAVKLSGLERPITVCAVGRPEWLRAVLEEPGVEEASLDESLAEYARAPSP